MDNVSMLQARQRHYINFGQPGECVFVTTTCLDFVHAFAEPIARDLMALSLIEDHRRYGAKLNAFVIMPHHIHFLTKLPDSRSASSFVARVKANSSNRLLKLLDQDVLRQFDQQRGLNRRTFWQRSFRSIALSESKSFWRKVGYIHNNPVRAGMFDFPTDYRWSSASAWEAGLWNDERGLDLAAISRQFTSCRHALGHWAAAQENAASTTTEVAEA